MVVGRGRTGEGGGRKEDGGRGGWRQSMEDEGGRGRGEEHM